MCDMQTSACLLLSFSTLNLCWLNRIVLRLYESFKNSCIFAMKSAHHSCPPPYKNRPAPYKIINGDTGIPSLH